MAAAAVLWLAAPVTGGSLQDTSKVDGRTVVLPFGAVVEAAFVVPTPGTTTIPTTTNKPTTTAAPTTATNDRTTATDNGPARPSVAAMGGSDVFAACAASFVVGAAWGWAVTALWARKGGKARARKAVEKVAECFAEV